MKHYFWTRASLLFDSGANATIPHLRIELHTAKNKNFHCVFVTSIATVTVIANYVYIQTNIEHYSDINRTLLSIHRCCCCYLMFGPALDANIYKSSISVWRCLFSYSIDLLLLLDSAIRQHLEM